jgi:protocatechuate 3,4-dioxygenase beta subunit
MLALQLVGSLLCSTPPLCEVTPSDVEGAPSFGQAFHTLEYENDLAGPFFQRSGTPQFSREGEVCSQSMVGERIHMFGSVRDEECGILLPNALVEVWQIKPNGLYDDPNNLKTSDCRMSLSSDILGHWRFSTIMPSKYSMGANSFRPQHIHFHISHEGYEPLTTQLYFVGDETPEGCNVCNSGNPLLRTELKQTTGGLKEGLFNIVLQRKTG